VSERRRGGPEPGGRADAALLAIGAGCGLLAVVAGALGAHALRGRLDVAQLGLFATATQYLMYHALALLAVVALQRRDAASAHFRRAGWCFVAGMALFSGSLYLRALAGVSSAALAPVGGLLLMAGWVNCLVGALVRGR
jgi:uncharacterized membrane protein YgdD (TMEM256/DUF423 family)